MMNKTQLINMLTENFEENSVYMDVIDVLEEMDNIDEIVCYLRDVITHGCVSGIVTHLIYNADIKNYFIEHSEDINDILYTMQYEEGIQLVLDTERYSYIETQVVWTVYEHACYEIENFIISELEI